MAWPLSATITPSHQVESADKAGEDGIVLAGRTLAEQYLPQPIAHLSSGLVIQLGHAGCGDEAQGLVVLLVQHAGVDEAGGKALLKWLHIPGQVIDPPLCRPGLGLNADDPRGIAQSSWGSRCVSGDHAISGEGDHTEVSQLDEDRSGEADVGELGAALALLVIEHDQEQSFVEVERRSFHTLMSPVAGTRKRLPTAILAGQDGRKPSAILPVGSSRTSEVMRTPVSRSMHANAAAIASSVSPNPSPASSGRGAPEIAGLSYRELMALIGAGSLPPYTDQCKVIRVRTVDVEALRTD